MKKAIIYIHGKGGNGREAKSMDHKFFTLANILTLSRMVLSGILLFLKPLSPWFIGIYLLCGLTDMVDGTIARKTNTVTELGSRLDTLADFIFVMSCLFILIPVVRLEPWMRLWIGGIAAIKCFSIIFEFVKRKQLLAMHTTMNKVTGLLIFILPLTFHEINYKLSVAVVCLVATLAAIQEGFRVIEGNQCKS